MEASLEAKDGASDLERMAESEVEWVQMKWVGTVNVSLLWVGAVPLPLSTRTSPEAPTLQGFDWLAR